VITVLDLYGAIIGAMFVCGLVLAAVLLLRWMWYAGLASRDYHRQYSKRENEFIKRNQRRV
jgi:H+/gluconate symporter-like permease